MIDEKIKIQTLNQWLNKNLAVYGAPKLERFLRDDNRAHMNRTEHLVDGLDFVTCLDYWNEGNVFWVKQGLVCVILNEDFVDEICKGRVRIA